MTQQARRRFVVGMGAAFAAGSLSVAVRAAMGPDDKFDLVIKGGDVLDPSQNLRGRRDIGIRFGRIEALEADIPATRAERVLEAGGRLVLPGPCRSAFARVSVRLGARHTGGRAGALPGNDHHGLGG